MSPVNVFGRLVYSFVITITTERLPTTKLVYRLLGDVLLVYRIHTVWFAQCSIQCEPKGQ